MIIWKDGIFRNIAPENWQMYHEKGYTQVNDTPEKMKRTAAKRGSETNSKY